MRKTGRYEDEFGKEILESGLGWSSKGENGG
jgi:hypothetical protein